MSSGIRQNLLSLQNTSNDLNTTQEQLSTGKKVNTAFDNPTSYFTSQSLTNRSNDLSALLDQIGQAQQTLNAANDGLTGLTSLLEQALSTAQQAQQASNDTAGATTGTVVLTTNTLAAGNLLIASGGSTYTVSIAASAALSTIESDINGTAGLGSTGAVTATDDGSGHLVLTANSPSTTFTASGAEQTAFGLSGTAVTGTSSTRTTLQSNYNSLLTQIDQLAGDSSYNGVNLLNGNNLHGQLQRKRHELADDHRRELQPRWVLDFRRLPPAGSRPTQRSRRRKRRSMPRSAPCGPRPRRSAPTRRPSRPARRSRPT